MNVVQILSLIVAAVSCLAAVVASYIAYTAYRKQTTPNVIVYLDLINGERFVRLVVENIGNAPAWDVDLRIESKVPLFEEIEDYEEPIDRKPFGKGILFLPPGGRRELPVGFVPAALDRMRGCKAFACLSYYSKKENPRRKTENRFPLETDSYDAALIPEPPLKRQLEKIADSIKDVDKELKDLKKKC